MVEAPVLMKILNEKIVTPTGCWDHPHQPNTDMPTLNAGRGTTITVRHAVYRFLKGSIPKEARVLTTCKNNRCFNPDHLVLSAEYERKFPKTRRKQPKERVIRYCVNNPSATVKEICIDCDCSPATAYRWKKTADAMLASGRIIVKQEHHA